MPKIKLSALASDIKGKANGSVFSTNSGGTYFRNNPSGGGRKSSKWDVQKNNFGSLSTVWKSLTQTQQEAWQDATVLYPTVNAFGDPRIPSGYELFMRLNGALVSAIRAGDECEDDAECGPNELCIDGECQCVEEGCEPEFEIILDPLAPRTIPNYGGVNVNYSELWQFNPLYAVQTYNNQKLNQPRFIVGNDILPDFEIMKNNTIGMRLKFASGPSYPKFAGSQIPILSMENGEDKQFNVFLQYDKDSVPYLYMSIIYGANSATWSCKLKESEMIEGFHFSIVTDDSNWNQTKIYINGSLRSQLLVSNGSPEGVNTGPTLYVGNNDTFQNACFAWNDLKGFTSKLNAANLKLISQGYVLGTEVIHFGGTEKTANKLINYGTAGNLIYLSLDSQSTNGTNGIPILWPLIPNFSLIIPNEGLEGLRLNIYATPPISNGITGSYNNFKLLCTIPWSDKGEYEVWRYYKKTFGNVPANTSVLFKVQWLDSTTGQKAQIATRAKPKKPRFKGGSELTDTVN